ncbi:hypothetical protein N9N97_02125, partial [Rickettsiaceae bacterium]|nr:hypothetical protein [Rickettsiaceae bacterium]
QDLEKLFKRPSSHYIPDILPFKQEFYVELEKPAGERSVEYNEFIEACSKIPPSRNVPERSSAAALMAMNSPDASVDSLKQDVTVSSDEYIKSQLDQTLKDQDRSAILVKGRDGKTRSLTRKQLLDPEVTGLTKEQIGFVNSSWNQGTFESGWFTGNPPARSEQQQMEHMLIPTDSKQRTQMLIDMSGGGVEVHNVVTSKLIDPMNPLDGVIPYVEASVSADITKLKGDRFTPGCASAKVDINFNVTRVNESLDFVVPEGLEVKRSNEPNNLASYVKEAAAEGLLNDIEHTRKFPDGSWESLKEEMGEAKAVEYVVDNIDKANISNDLKGEIIEHINGISAVQDGQKIDPKLCAKSVELFCKLEQDPKKRAMFASDKLDSYLSNQASGHLGDKELNLIKDGIVDIMSPACDNKVERAALKESAAHIVRDCATEVGSSTSFSQKWEHFKDRVKDVANYVIGRENKAQKIMHDNPKLMEKIKQNLAPKGKVNNGPVPVNKDHGKGGGAQR